MMALQLEPSAHAPWTRTIFGLTIMVIPFAAFAGCAESLLHVLSLLASTRAAHR
jgi:hypothetical protein